MMKCDIELDGIKLKRGMRWWWELILTTLGCSISGRNEYKSRSSALRNARVWAKRLGFEVVRVYTYGKEPENDA